MVDLSRNSGSHPHPSFNVKTPIGLVVKVGVAERDARQSRTQEGSPLSHRRLATPGFEQLRLHSDGLDQRAWDSDPNAEISATVLGKSCYAGGVRRQARCEQPGVASSVPMLMSPAPR